MKWFENKRVAASFSGICYGVKHRDWRRDWDNIKTNLIDPIQPQIYVTTYHNETVDHLLDVYKPVKYQLLALDGSDLRLTYRRSLEMLLNEPIDLVVSTRYDILFNSSTADYNIDPDKFNFFFKEKGWWGPHQYTADPQYFSVFPVKFIPALIDGVQSVYDNPHRHDCPDLHPTYSRLAPVIGEENINFIFDVETLSHDNEYVSLDRRW